MEHLTEIKIPSKKEQDAAMKSYNALTATLKDLHSDNLEIEIEENSEKIAIPLKALKLLATILKATSQGKAISLVPSTTEMTTQDAADFLGCSRPHLVKMLEKGRIPFTMTGKHRRVRFQDLTRYKNDLKLKQEKFLIEMMKSDEALGLYNS